MTVWRPMGDVVVVVRDAPTYTVVVVFPLTTTDSVWVTIASGSPLAMVAARLAVDTWVNPPAVVIFCFATYGSLAPNRGSGAVVVSSVTPSLLVMRLAPTASTRDVDVSPAAFVVVFSLPAGGSVMAWTRLVPWGLVAVTVV